MEASKEVTMQGKTYCYRGVKYTKWARACAPCNSGHHYWHWPLRG